MKYFVLKLPLFWTADSVKQFYQDQFLWKVLPKSSGYIFYSTQSGFLALKSEYMHSIYIHAWITWILIPYCIFFIATYANRRAVHSHFEGKVEKIPTIFNKEIKNHNNCISFWKKRFSRCSWVCNASTSNGSAQSNWMWKLKIGTFTGGVLFIL